MPSTQDVPGSSGPERWPPLLLALRRAARPDRARVAAYLGLTQGPAGWTAYAEFLELHRGWLAALDRTLAEAGLNAPSPLPDAAEPFGAGGGVSEARAEGASLTPPSTRAEALGYLYVLEAFRLGCAVLARRIRGRAEPRADQRPWNELTTALAELPAGDHAAAVQAAKDVFSAWDRQVAGPLVHLGLGALSREANAA